MSKLTPLQWPDDWCRWLRRYGEYLSGKLDYADLWPRVHELPLPVPAELLGFRFNQLPMAIVVKR